MEQSRNVDALQAGIWILVEQQIPKISDVFMLQSLMKCIGKDAPISLKRKIENKILKELDRFSSSDAQQTFSALAAMNYCSFPILNACSNKIIENIYHTPFEESIRVLRSCSILQYHNVALCSAMANYVTSGIFMWNTDEITPLLSVFEDLGFRAVELMDIFAEKVTNDPELLDLKAILIVLRAYSRLNHVPKCQNEFLESLSNALNMYLPRISNVDLLKAVFSFCTLGYLPQPALNQLLQEDILNELLTSDGIKKEQNNMMLHYVNVCLELDSPSSFTKPAAVFIKKSSLRLVYGFPEVQEALLKLLGDESMFQQNIELPYDYKIDFKIKMDADRKKVLPVTEADDLADDLDVQRLAVLCGHISDFCVGTSHPQGMLAMKIRHLKALGYHVILVHYHKFKTLKKEEAIKWLKGKIYSAEAFHGSCVNLQDNC
ncbi:FAST kinase domain-containing protein 2, mitochondrial isoform X2 [Emydura macquarii macquarii]